MSIQPTPPESTDPQQCLNCGAEVSWNFCPNCGQERSARIVPAAHLLHEAIDEFFKLDSKFGSSIIPLLTRPGFLTNEYIAGRRVRYVSPFRLYFIVSALYFLCFSFAHYDVAVMHGLAYGIEQAHPSHLSDDSSNMDASGHRSAHMHSGSVGTGNRAEEDRAHRHTAAVDKTAMWFTKNQSMLTFLLVPFAALLLKLVYISSKRLYIEHLVFAVHVQTFLFVLLLPALLPIGRDVSYVASLVLSALYLFLAMRAVYKQHPAATLIKCGVMLCAYVATMSVIAYLAFLTFYRLG